MKKLLAFVFAGLVCAGAFALAQSTPLYRWLGTETFRITLGSGSGVDINLDTVRSTESVSPIGAGSTVNVSPTGLVPTIGTLLATGAITVWNVTLPNPANQGQKVCVSNGTGSNFTTNVNVDRSPVTTSQTHTMNTSYASQTLAAGASACWVFQMTSNTAGTWFRIQ